MHLPTHVPCCWLLIGLSAQVLCPVQAQTGVPSGPMQDTARLLQHATVRSSGSIEFGGIHGMLPYSSELSGPWNAFAKGNVGFVVGGIPLKVICDLGTDVPFRGQRNNIRFIVDAPKLIDEAGWADAKLLHVAQGRLDSLETLKLDQFRKVSGIRSKLLKVNGHFGQAVPSWPQADSAWLGAPGHPDTLHSPGLNLQPVQHETASYGKADSLRAILSRERQELERLDGLVGRQRMHAQRMQAVMQAKKAESGVIGKFIQGVKRLELGTCSPTSSEFLINSLNFQGVSFEYQRKGVYVAFDKGRSFDDAWLDSNPVDSKLRALQQSFFISEARELDARKLTALKVGVGARDATHFHIGYLKGTRPGLHGAYLPPGQAPTLHNHVVEADMGYAIGKEHLLRLTLGRSVAGTNESTGAGGSQVGDLFSRNQGADQAAKLEWTSTLNATGTQVSAGLLAITPYFQSFGMGYIRNGARALETKVEQRIGNKLRLRTRYMQERRTLAPRRAFDIQRLHMMVLYRPARAWSIRAGVLPVRAIERAPEAGLDTRTRNWVYTAGGEYRRRWKQTVAVLGADFSLYQGQVVGEKEMVQNTNVSLSLFNASRWRTSVVWSGLMPWAEVGTTSSNLVIDISGRVRKSWEVSIGGQWPNWGNAGWLGEVQHTVSKHFAVGFRGQSFARPDLIFAPDSWTDQNNAYNWTLLTTLVW